MMLDTLYKLPLKTDFYLQGFPCFYDLFNGGERVFPVHRLQGKVPDAFSVPPCRAVPFLLVGKSKPPQFSRFLSGFEPGVSSRRETGPCTESGGSSCSGCCRSWPSFGSTQPPACRTRRSAFGTNSRILEEDVSGMEAPEVGRVFRTIPTAYAAPRIEFGVSGGVPYCWCLELPGCKPCVALEGPFNLLFLPTCV